MGGVHGAPASICLMGSGGGGDGLAQSLPAMAKKRKNTPCGWKSTGGRKQGPGRLCPVHQREAGGIRSGCQHDQKWVSRGPGPGHHPSQCCPCILILCSSHPPQPQCGSDCTSHPQPPSLGPCPLTW